MLSKVVRMAGTDIAVPTMRSEHRSLAIEAGNSSGCIPQRSCCKIASRQPEPDQDRQVQEAKNYPY